MASPAPACLQAIRDANRRWPSRRKISDGIMGDARHQKTKSDHNMGNAFDLTHDPASGCSGDVIAAAAIRDPRVKYVIWNRRIFNRQRGDTHFRPYHGKNAHTHHCHVSVLASSRADTRPWAWAPGGRALSAAIDHAGDGGGSNVNGNASANANGHGTSHSNGNGSHANANGNGSHAGSGSSGTPRARSGGASPVDRRPFPGVQLRRGARGELVTLVQERLRRLRWDTHVDGLFGEETERIVRAFQKRHDLSVDGVIGRRTWSALFG